VGKALYVATLSELFQALVEKGQETVFASSLTELRQGHLASLEIDQPVLALASARWDTANKGAQALFVGTKGGGLRVLTLGEGRSELVPIAQGNVSQYVRQNARISAICAHPTRAGFVCVATEQGLYASMDGGAAWFPTANELAGERVSALLLDPAEDVIYAGVVGGGVHASRDNGATWQRHGKGLTNLSVNDLAIVTDLTGQRMLLAATNDGPWRLPLTSAKPQS
jgi:hypothetical protein